MMPHSSAPRDHSHPTADRRRALQVLIGLPLAAVSLSLASCTNLDMHPADTSKTYGGGRGPGNTGGGPGNNR